ncbi:DUF1735 domain-containing protein [Confluentibacter citreus]|uniref:DUF1735 domain-containing protein n=1 Tax=Confluentibacter citreus TaxID=2007307 RepID=UPI000C28676D|nr:DUF1735 domain-containing protein [Confluentibacter citreus]
MRKILNITFIIFSIFLFQNCEEETEAVPLDYITFAKSTYSTGVDPGGAATFDITVYTANITSSDRNYNVIVAPNSNAAAGSYTVPSSVTIPSGSNEGILTIALTDTNLGIGVNNLILNFEKGANYFIGASTTLSYIQNCTEVTGSLDIVFDGYGSECTWEIIDALGGVVASGGPYTDGQASTSPSITLCSGREYTFTIYDSFGDGLSFPANGSYVLTIGGEVKASGGGDYGAEESTDFDTN